MDEALGLEARLPVAEAEVDEHLERGAVRGPSSGTVPVMWNHVVPHAQLHGVPTANGR
ncbi:hypothetical protein MAFF212519_10290 [Clavibacter michiganensis]